MVFREEKYRDIDNSRRNLHNASPDSCKCIYTTSYVTGVAALRRLRERAVAAQQAVHGAQNIVEAVKIMA